MAWHVQRLFLLIFFFYAPHRTAQHSRKSVARQPVAPIEPQSTLSMSEIHVSRTSTIDRVSLPPRPTKSDRRSYWADS
jgi:hypothetical protein